MEFTGIARKIAEQLTINYDWHKPPPNHSGWYWRDSLFVPAEGFRFDILGLTIEQCFEKIDQVEKHYMDILVPEIQQKDALCLKLQRQLSHKFDKKIKQELEDAQNEILGMNEPLAQIRAFQEIWTSYIK